LSCIGIISALSAEASCLTDKTIPVNTPVHIDEHTIAMVCGMGEKNARAAAQILIKKEVSALVSWGTAGALTENLHVGDLLLADTVVSNDANKYSFDTEWNKRIANELCNTSLKIRHGMIAHAQQVLAAVEDKKILHHKTNALAVDMESIAIAQLAYGASLPCVAVRAIVDEASQSVPEEILNNIDSFGRPDLFPLFSSLIRKPGLVVELIKLGKGMNAATKTLNTVAKSQALFK
jgi:adenosylhomocysteine nucleosidase